MATRRSPQEKKVLDYQRDRRNAYGENDKSSRRSVHDHKLRVNRWHRRAVRGVLQGARELDPEDLGSEVSGVRRRRWRKVPDMPLGRWVDAPGRLRQERGGHEPSRSPLRDEAARRSTRWRRRSLR